ncbi:Acetyltransferase component of pyruvate dehydrogenase complex [Sphingomonas antarctica]|uniref:pyruvate dehydrogenase complex dihydrolipoamide acetyltransferase n=1 Tax=Sphingomonas antarctica TaxID=2040274 RepID=UPI0039E77709
MPIELKMPALSPTMEEGTLAKWLVKAGDTVKSGDILAEIETDKATMEFEAVDEGTISEILVAEGSDGVKVGTVIATMSGDDDSAHPGPAKAEAVPPASGSDAKEEAPTKTSTPQAGGTGPKDQGGQSPAPKDAADRVKASPLAKKIAEQAGVDLKTLTGTGPGGRIVKADVEQSRPTLGATQPVPPASGSDAKEVLNQTSTPQAGGAGPQGQGGQSPFTTDIPHERQKLTNIRKTIARRLTESKQQVPHIYLTVDIRLDALLKLRGEINTALADRGVKVSVNDMLVKALALSLLEVPACNVTYTPAEMIQYHRADISVAVSTPSGLITPIVVDAGHKAISAISTEMKVLADKAKAGKLQPHEYVGGTASISNMGMMGIKQFDAVINPPQGMIMAIGAGEQRPYVVDNALAIATVMSATGSFDHRAIDGADGAQLMGAFKRLVEAPLGLVA